MRLTESQLKTEIRKLLKESKYKKMTDEQLDTLFAEFVEDFKYVGPPDSGLTYIENKFDPDIRLGPIVQRGSIDLFTTGFKEKDYQKFIKGVNLRTKDISNIGNKKVKLGNMLDWYEGVSQDTDIKPAEPEKIVATTQEKANVNYKAELISELAMYSKFRSTPYTSYKIYQRYYNTIYDKCKAKNSKLDDKYDFKIQNIVNKDDNLVYVATFNNLDEFGKLALSMLEECELLDKNDKENDQLYVSVFERTMLAKQYMDWQNTNSQTLNDIFVRETDEMKDILENITSDLDADSGIHAFGAEISDDEELEEFTNLCISAVDNLVDILRVRREIRLDGTFSPVLQEAKNLGYPIGFKVYGMEEDHVEGELKFLIEDQKELLDIVSTNTADTNTKAQNSNLKIRDLVDVIINPMVSGFNGYEDHLTPESTESIMSILKKTQEVLGSYELYKDYEDLGDDDEDDESTNEYYFPLDREAAEQANNYASTKSDKDKKDDLSITIDGLTVTSNSKPQKDRERPNKSKGDHKGLDYIVNLGTDVYAVVSGTTTHGGGPNNTAGNYIDLEGDDGNTYRYMHLYSRQKAGKVSGGDKIGRSGDSGKMTGGGEYGAHLHLGIKFEGEGDFSHDEDKYKDLFEDNDAVFPNEPEEEKEIDTGTSIIDTGEE